jgi:hypothetical protein
VSDTITAPDPADVGAALTSALFDRRGPITTLEREESVEITMPLIVHDSARLTDEFLVIQEHVSGGALVGLGVGEGTIHAMITAFVRLSHDDVDVPQPLASPVALQRLIDAGAPDQEAK